MSFPGKILDKHLLRAKHCANTEKGKTNPLPQGVQVLMEDTTCKQIHANKIHTG